MELMDSWEVLQTQGSAEKKPNKTKHDVSSDRVLSFPTFLLGHATGVASQVDTTTSYLIGNKISAACGGRQSQQVSVRLGQGCTASECQAFPFFFGADVCEWAFWTWTVSKG